MLLGVCSPGIITMFPMSIIHYNSPKEKSNRWTPGFFLGDSENIELPS